MPYFSKIQSQALSEFILSRLKKSRCVGEMNAIPMRQKFYIARGAVVAERSRSLLHGTGGPRFESRRRRFSFVWNFVEIAESRKSIALRQNGWMDARA